MNPGAAAEAIEIEVRLRADGGLAMARDIRLGLTAKPKELAPKYFYDERGSQLFERITELPEYYPTRAEREILVRALGRDRRRGGGARDPGRARLRLRREDAPPAERDARRRLPRHLRPGRHLRGDHPRNRGVAGRGVPRPGGPRPRLRLRARPRADSQRRRRPPRRLPRRHDRQPLPGRPPRLPRPRSRPCSSRETGSCSAPTWSRSRAGWRPPTTTPRGSPPSSTRTCCRC